MNSEKIFEKKTNNFEFELNDIPVEGELMVTITLNEYRKLITQAAELRFERQLRIDAERKLKEINGKGKAVCADVPRM